MPTYYYSAQQSFPVAMDSSSAPLLNLTFAIPAGIFTTAVLYVESNSSGPHVATFHAVTSSDSCDSGTISSGLAYCYFHAAGVSDINAAAGGTAFPIALTIAGGSEAVGGCTLVLTGTLSPPAPPTASLTAIPISIVSGERANLIFATTNAASASINNGVSTVTPVSGGNVFVAPSVTTTYTLTVIGLDSSTITRTATVIVGPSASPPKGPGTPVC